MSFFIDIFVNRFINEQPDHMDIYLNTLDLHFLIMWIYFETFNLNNLFYYVNFFNDYVKILVHVHNYYFWQVNLQRIRILDALIHFVFIVLVNDLLTNYDFFYNKLNYTVLYTFLNHIEQIILEVVLYIRCFFRPLTDFAMQQ